jgi:hypothetical protein
VENWQPVAYRVRTLTGSVRLHGGMFSSAMENNVRYLLESYTVDDLLRQFRQRAGRAASPSNAPLTLVVRRDRRA